MTTYHLADSHRLRAACGQLPDGIDHTTATAGVVRGMASLVPARVCPACLAAAREQESTR